MNSMKKKVILAAVAVSATLGTWAETKTWDGGASGDYCVDDNWSLSGVPKADDDVVIAGAVTVTYAKAEDLVRNAGTVFSVSNGASFIQDKGIGNWPKVCGKLVLDGGVADFTAATTFRVGDGGEIEVKNGGEFNCQKLSFNNVTTSGTLTVGPGGVLNATSFEYGENGTIDITGGTLNLDGVLNVKALTITDGRIVFKGRLAFYDASQGEACKLQVRGGAIINHEEIVVGNTIVSNAVVSATAFTSGGLDQTYQPIPGVATRFVSTITAPGVETASSRWTDVPFGMYPRQNITANLLNLIPGIIDEENKVIPPSSGFQFRYDDENWPQRTDKEIYTGLFAENRVKYNGASVDDATFAKTFRIINDETAKTLLVTTWYDLDARVSGVWTMMDGAVVTLADSVTLEGLTIKGSHSIIDLNGKTLRVPVGSLRVGGEMIAVGTYTAKDVAAAGWSVKVIDESGVGKIRVTDPKCGLMMIVR